MSSQPLAVLIRAVLMPRARLLGSLFSSFEVIGLRLRWRKGGYLLKAATLTLVYN